MNKLELKKRQEQQFLAESENRARSFTIGTCFGGTVEVSMRRADGSNTFAILQPVEVTEMIHQLAASIGCHINIQPRHDFASWRDWKYSDEQLAHYRGVQPFQGVGHPPHSKDMAPHQNRGQVLPAPEQQPGLQPAMMARSESNEQTVATQKTVGRKRTKRAAAAA